MSGLTRWESFRVALSGLVYALRTQRNAQIEVIAATLVAACGLWLGISWMEWAILVIAIGVVFVAEMVNTAVEFEPKSMNPDG